jgi:transposase
MATGSEIKTGQIPPPRPPDGSASKGEPIDGGDADKRGLPAHARSACEQHRSFIEEQVRYGRNATAIYQDLVDQHAFTHRYNSVKRFCRSLKFREPEQFDRLEFLPGEEAQVDYGEGAPTLHANGKYRKPRLFVMTLRYSRRSFRKVVWKSSQETWARLHEEAFRYFGGCPQYVVLDNLREGVIKPDLYEPEINRVYAAMLALYGVVADPARVRDPNRKGTVESAIQHTQGTALKGRRFESIEAQNEHLMHWEEKWAASRVHGREKRQVSVMFEEEKPHLKKLPAAGMLYFEESKRTVQDDTTIQVAGSWYAARPARIGSQVIVRVYDLEIEIRDIGTLELIRRHPRSARKGEVKLPDAERVFNPSRQTNLILNQAGQIGPKAHELCQKLFEHRGREGQKAMWGIVGLAHRRRYPARIVEKACASALDAGISSLKAIQKLADDLFSEALARMEASQIELPLANAPSGLTQNHELIRTNDEYAEFFNKSVSQTQQRGELQ